MCKKDNKGITGGLGVSYWITPNLRYKNKSVNTESGFIKIEPRLQQMWQGDDGSQKWEWIEVVE